MGDDHGGSGEVPPSLPGDTSMDDSKEDPSTGKASGQETSSQKGAKANRNLAHPSKTPRKALKYTDNQCTILDPHGHPIASLRLTDVAKGKKGTESEVGKCKELATPDLGSRGASPPLRK